MNYIFNKRNSNQRRGSILSEAIVSAAILMAGIGIVARAQYNLRRLWGDTRHFQLATDELSNQLERLSNQNKTQVIESLQNLQVSQPIANVLPEAKIVGELVEDSHGTRIQLSLDWKRIGQGKPLELTGWLLSGDLAKSDTNSKATSQESSKPDPSPSDTPSDLPQDTPATQATTSDSQNVKEVPL